MASPRHLQQVLDSVPSALISIGPDHTVLYRNRPAARLAPQLEPGADVWSALKPVVNEEKIDRMMRGERVIFRTSPESPMLEWLIAADHPDDGSVILMAWDIAITDEIVQGRITFSMSASHELRSPLTALLGFAEILEIDRDNLSEGQAEAAAIILQNARYLKTMVDDIIDLSRNSFGELRIEIGDIDVARVISEVAESLRPQIEASGQRLDVRIEEKTPSIEADDKRIRQIIFNLLQNAHVHTPEGTTIEISAVGTGPEVLIEVSDDGEGLPFENPEDAFGSFRSGLATGGDPMTGSGIGLTISRQLAELHRGTLEVESKAGEGTRFTLRLPVMRDAARKLVSPGDD